MRISIAWSVFMLIAFACKGGDEDACIPGQIDCACIAGACHAGLVCSNDVCIYSGGSVSQGDDTDGTSASDSATTTTGADTSTGGDTSPTARAVDLLLVIDNSGLMSAIQATLAANIPALIDPLEGGDVDWRIGITTTDNGNPWCNGTTPENGALRFTSCRTRTQEFIFNGAMMVDATQEACLDICTVEDLGVQPTATELDPDPAPRPWLERIGGTLNSSLTPAEVLRCALPQGINGCGFEQPLEAMAGALARFENADEPAYGFLRADALLAVVFVTDEADCSHNPDWTTIFLPMENSGNEVFWSDPANQSSPTSAVCWNAGTTCTGSGSPYDECHAEDKDVNGDAVAGGAADSDAVLYPLSRYVDLLATRPSYLAAIDGVPEGYEQGSEIVYQVSLDAEDQLNFGIGPACETSSGKAVPSVRVRELVEGVRAGERNDFSICAPDLGPALTTIAERVLAQLP